MKNIAKLLTKGLLKGYTKGDIKNISRGRFNGKQSILLEENKTYHDEWFVPTHTGGGQELVNFNGQMYTRLYGGGTPDPEKVESLGIKIKDVSKFLKENISKLKGETRLFKNYEGKEVNGWKYSYEITRNYSETKTVTSVELIKYKGNIVHVHAFILCPVK